MPENLFFYQLKLDAKYCQWKIVYKTNQFVDISHISITGNQPVQNLVTRMKITFITSLKTFNDKNNTLFTQFIYFLLLNEVKSVILHWTTSNRMLLKLKQFHLDPFKIKIHLIGPHSILLGYYFCCYKFWGIILCNFPLKFLRYLFYADKGTVLFVFLFYLAKCESSASFR